MTPKDKKNPAQLSHFFSMSWPDAEFMIARFLLTYDDYCEDESGFAGIKCLTPVAWVGFICTYVGFACLIIGELQS